MQDGPAGAASEIWAIHKRGRLASFPKNAQASQSRHGWGSSHRASKNRPSAKIDDRQRPHVSCPIATGLPGPVRLALDCRCVHLDLQGDCASAAQP